MDIGPLQSVLTPDEFNLFKPEKFTDSDNVTWVSLQYLSPDKRYVVFAGAEISAQDGYSYNPIMLLDRQLKRAVNTTLQIVHPFDVRDFKVIWNSDSSAFVVMSTPNFGFVVLTYYGYVTNFRGSMSQMKVRANSIEPTVWSKQYLVDDQIFELSRDGQWMLALARDVASADERNEQAVKLLLVNLQDLSQSRAFDEFDGKKILTASFMPNDEGKLLIVNDSGLIQYDIATQTTTVLNTTITSSWANEAVFSPDSKWLAVGKRMEDVSSSSAVYVVNLFDVLASPDSR